MAAKHTVRIRLKAYDHEILDQSTKKIVETVKRTQATFSGPVPLPTEKHRYTVVRSPFKDKDSREHFEMHIMPRPRREARFRQSLSRRPRRRGFPWCGQ